MIVEKVRWQVPGDAEKDRMFSVAWLHSEVEREAIQERKHRWGTDGGSDDVFE
jgi:hypothetical protein